MKTLKYIEGIGWRYDTEHNMHRRQSEHDYTSRCIYMITISLYDRSIPLLGSLRWGDNNHAEFLPSPLGERVTAEWLALKEEYPQLSITHLQMMPDHLHIVLFVTKKLPLHLGKIIGKAKNRCNRHYWDSLIAAGRLGNKGTGAPPQLFCKGFQDTILRHKGQLETMLRYVDDNPRRALIKRENPQLFRVVRDLWVDTANDINSTYDAAELRRTQTVEFKDARCLRFAAIGNRWLLEKPERLQVRCHNNNTPLNLQLIEKQKEYFLERTRQGAIIVSPCISSGEKAIARALLDAGLPLIVILENGFTPMYKPSGKYFDACCKGNLLMLAPWPYHMERRKITRSQCLELNAMTAALSSEPWTGELEKQLKDNDVL